MSTLYSLPYDVQKTSQRERYLKSICLLIVACEAQTKMTNIIAFVYRYFEHTFQYQRNNKQTEWYWEQSIHLCTKSNMQNGSEQVQYVHKSIESLRTASHRIALHRSLRSFIRSSIPLVHHVAPVSVPSIVLKRAQFDIILWLSRVLYQPPNQPVSQPLPHVASNLFDWQRNFHQAICKIYQIHIAIPLKSLEECVLSLCAELRCARSYVCLCIEWVRERR